MLKFALVGLSGVVVNFFCYRLLVVAPGWTCHTNLNCALPTTTESYGESGCLGFEYAKLGENRSKFSGF